MLTPHRAGGQVVSRVHFHGRGLEEGVVNTSHLTIKIRAFFFSVRSCVHFLEKCIEFIRVTLVNIITFQVNNSIIHHL